MQLPKITAMSASICISQFATAACLAALAFTATPASAAERPLQVLTETVDVADLDMTAAQGAEALVRRVTHVAERLCAQPASPMFPGSSAATRKCVHKALAQSAASLDAPQVALAYQRYTHEALPASLVALAR
jgi:UrcA family protein